MRVVRHPNPITEMRWRVSQQMPQGVLKKDAKHHHNPSQGRSTRTRDYRGIALARWFLDNGMVNEAQVLINKLQAELEKGQDT